MEVSEDHSSNLSIDILHLCKLHWIYTQKSSVYLNEQRVFLLFFTLIFNFLHKAVCSILYEFKKWLQEL